MASKSAYNSANANVLPCPKCSSRLALKHVEHRPLGYELRKYECATCGRPHEIFVSVDPMKSPAGNWINSELRAPD